MNRKIIGNKYQVLRILFQDENYCSAVCRDISKPDSENTYILNIYRSKPAIIKAAPVFTKVSSDICNDFREFFVDSPDVVSVFAYYDNTPIEAYVSGDNLSLKDRLALCSSFLLEMVRNDNIPVLLKLSILKPENIVVDDEKKVRLNFITNLELDGEEQNMESRLSMSISSIAALILGNRKKLPEEIVLFLSKLKSGKYNMMSTILSEFTSISEALMNAQDDDGKNLKEKAKKALAKTAKKHLKIPAPLVALRIAIIVLAAAALAAAGYYIYRSMILDSPVAEFSKGAEEIDTIDSSTLVKLSPKTPAKTEPVPSIEPAETKEEDEIVYIVKKDDNLYDIAVKFYGNGELYTVIKERNNLSSNLIYVDMELIIPTLNPHK